MPASSVIDDLEVTTKLTVSETTFLEALGTECDIKVA